MARSFLGGEFAGGKSAWRQGNWIPLRTHQSSLYLFFIFVQREGEREEHV